MKKVSLSDKLGGYLFLWIGCSGMDSCKGSILFLIGDMNLLFTYLLSFTLFDEFLVFLKAEASTNMYINTIIPMTK